MNTDSHHSEMKNDFNDDTFNPFGSSWRTIESNHAEQSDNFRESQIQSSNDAPQRDQIKRMLQCDKIMPHVISRSARRDMRRQRQLKMASKTSCRSTTCKDNKQVPSQKTSTSTLDETIAISNQGSAHPEPVVNHKAYGRI